MQRRPKHGLMQSFDRFRRHRQSSLKCNSRRLNPFLCGNLGGFGRKHVLNQGHIILGQGQSAALHRDQQLPIAFCVRQAYVLQQLIHGSLRQFRQRTGQRLHHRHAVFTGRLHLQQRRFTRTKRCFQLCPHLNSLNLQDGISAVLRDADDRPPYHLAFLEFKRLGISRLAIP
ncbi:hypothetical protein PAECIP111890_04056 [Paenibacillus sp. JJ-223]|nr:hypothetical protein PAECIP111890_04056 [Paenibacillus sp. JJ-223]